MNFGALSRGFGTCCLRFKNRVATIPAKLASGWLARLYREGVEPSGSLQKVSDHISRPPFLDLSWRKGSFILNLPSHYSITSSAWVRSVGGTSRPSAFAVVRCIREVKPPLSPENVIAEFVSVLKSYHCHKVTGDRYGGEFPREQFR